MSALTVTNQKTFPTYWPWMKNTQRQKSSSVMPFKKTGRENVLAHTKIRRLFGGVRIALCLVGKWDRVLEWDGVHHKWFTGAKTNITINALDRHAKSDRCNRAAFIWLGEDGSERIVTYGQLHRYGLPFRQWVEIAGRGEGRSRRSSICP